MKTKTPKEVIAKLKTLGFNRSPKNDGEVAFETFTNKHGQLVSFCYDAELELKPDHWEFFYADQIDMDEYPTGQGYKALYAFLKHHCVSGTHTKKTAPVGHARPDCEGDVLCEECYQLEMACDGPDGSTKVDWNSVYTAIRNKHGVSQKQVDAIEQFRADTDRSQWYGVLAQALSKKLKVSKTKLSAVMELLSDAETEEWGETV